MITSSKKKIEKHHSNCIVCGQQNNRSWKLKFLTDKSGKTFTKFKGDNEFQGYNGILHGGVISTLLDATMTHCLFDHGIIALTGDLHVRFVHSIPYNATIDLEAQIITASKHIYILKSEAILQQKIMAWAKAKFVPINFINS